ncbi:carbohydrate kinase family protein [Nonomuraea sp. NPDC049725]|uniref:carbohydrate kinase family protein n=1 Tax=Nonomuraea sp. NPDC049725 TaxID=3154508 RepID=UPI00342213AC
MTAARPPGGRAGRLVVIGEIRVDVRVRLDSLRFADLDANRLHYGAVDVTPAGVALGLARQAVGRFDRVELVARIGRDAFTETILAELAALGVEPRLTVVEGVCTGRVVVVRDAGPGDGVRLMVAEPLPEGQLLAPADVRAAGRAIAEADVLFLTGYELLHPRSARAVLEAAGIAHAGGTLVCVDMVPHDLHLRVDSRRWLPALHAADVVVAELQTLNGLLGTPCATPAQLFPHLDAALPGGPVWLIRSGAGNMGRSTVYHHGLVHRDYETGYELAREPMGFGDAVTAAELRWLLSAWPLSSRSAHGSSARNVARKSSRVANVP